MCTTPGFYLNDALESKYGAELVQVADAPAAARELISGGCLAGAPRGVLQGLLLQASAAACRVVCSKQLPALPALPCQASTRRPGQIR